MSSIKVDDKTHREFLARDFPRDAPTEDIDEAPVRCYRVNEQWAKHVTGAISVLAEWRAWNGDDDERDSAVQAILQLLQGEECEGAELVFQDVRQSEDGCELEKQIDGDWSPFADLTLCGVGEDSGQDYQVNLNQNLIMQMILADLYDGTPTSIHPEVPDVTFDTDQSGNIDPERETALCMAVQAFVGSYCARKVQELDRQYLGVFLILAGIAIITGGIGLLAGLAIGGAVLVGSWDYPETRAALLDLDAQQAVACCMLAGLTGTDVMLDGDMEEPDTDDWPEADAIVSKETGDPQAGTRNLRLTYDGGTQNYTLQSILVDDDYYRTDGYARDDGTVYPELRQGSTVLWTGTTSASYQFFDVTYQCTSGLNIVLWLIGSSGYVEFDSMRTIRQVAVSAGGFEDSLDGCGFTPSTNEDIVADYVADSIENTSSYLSFLNALALTYIQVSVYGVNMCACGDECDFYIDWESLDADTIIWGTKSTSEAHSLWYSLLGENMGSEGRQSELEHNTGCYVGDVSTWIYVRHGNPNGRFRLTVTALDGSDNPIKTVSDYYDGARETWRQYTVNLGVDCEKVRVRAHFTTGYEGGRSIWIDDTQIGSV